MANSNSNTAIDYLVTTTPETVNEPSASIQAVASGDAATAQISKATITVFTAVGGHLIDAVSQAGTIEHCDFIEAIGNQMVESDLPLAVQFGLVKWCALPQHQPPGGVCRE